jgi:hypothetical protein
MRSRSCRCFQPPIVPGLRGESEFDSPFEMRSERTLRLGIYFGKDRIQHRMNVPESVDSNQPIEPDLLTGENRLMLGHTFDIYGSGKATRPII